MCLCGTVTEIIVKMTQDANYYVALVVLLQCINVLFL